MSIPEAPYGRVNIIFFSYELVVRAGTENPQLISSIENKILRHIPHPKYEEAFYFDVALIILEEVILIYPRLKDKGWSMVGTFD